MEKRFQEKLKDWKRKEGDIVHRREQDANREREAVKDQMRVLKRELDFSTDEELENSERPAVIKRLEERRLVRMKEE